MPHSNSLAGCCYLCASYVAIGKGELVKQAVPGHRYSLRCGPCSLQAAKPNPTPTEAVLSENAARLLRQSVRKSIRDLLNDADMPPDKVRPAQAWLESQQWPIEDLYRGKDRLIQLRNEGRDHRLNGRSQAA